MTFRHRRDRHRRVVPDATDISISNHPNRRVGALALFVGLAVGLASVLPVPPAVASSANPSHREPAARFLLALGDSISFGFQASKVGTAPDPAAFTTGYVDVLAARDAGLAVTNYSCPGETTTTMIHGGCPWTAAGFALHDGYQGSQLAAAVTFLQAHRMSPGTVTLAVWGNDVAALSAACNGDLVCVSERAPTEIAAFAARLDAILRALRSADPSAQVVVIAAVHSYPPPSPEIDGLYAALNRAIDATATSAHAQVADIVPIFNPADPAVRATAICTLTLTCLTNGADGHPSDAGYVAIADAITAMARGRSRS